MRGTSFGQSAEEYDRVRLAPPPAILSWLLTGREAVVLDLAAGTGQISRQLDRPGCAVVAVEPDERMRAVLARRCPQATVVAGFAEDIPLADAAVDAVLVGSAWHWFDPEPALAEIARVLRPGGRLGAVGICPDPFVDWVAAMLDVAAEPLRASVRAHYAEVTLPSTAFGPVETHTASLVRSWEPAQVHEQLATTSSYLIADAAEQARRDTVVDGVLAERFPGATRVDFPLRASAWRTERR